MMKNSVKNLIEFIDHSPSCFHVIENARKQFMDHGFIELKEKEYWNLEELFCYKKWKFDHRISFAEKRFSRLSYRGKPQ